MIIRVAKMAVAGLVLTGLAACAHHGAAQISSIPSGAEVVDMDGDVLLGVTPVKVWWKENKESRKFINVRIQKDGYRDKTTSFWVTLRHSTRDSAVENPQMVEISLDKTE